MRPLGRALLALVVLSLGSLGQSTDTLVAGPLQVRLECPWPTSVTKGYQPMKVRVTHQGESPEVLSLEIRGGWNDDLRISESLLVAPLETVEFEVLVPAYLADARNFRVIVEGAGNKSTSNSLGASGSTDEYVHNVVVFSDGAQAAGRAERWGQELTATSSTGSPRYWNSRWRNLGFHLDKDWEAKASVAVTDVSFEDMSRDWRAYTSLDAVVVDLANGSPPHEALEALLAWGRTGGAVIFSGRDATALLAKDDAAQPWLEDRFGLEPRLAAPKVRRYQNGFGRLLVAPTEGLLDDTGVAGSLLGELRERVRTEWTPSPRGSRGSGLSFVPSIPGLSNLPYRAFVALMLLFGILVWPVNFYFVRKKGRPVWLLITIPAIALVASLMVLSYGFFWQGLEIQTQSTTVALLDQRSGVVENAEVRALYAGLAPGRGLVPGSGTAIFPWGASDRGGRTGIYRIEHTEGEERYAASFLPSRTQVRQALVTDRTSRLRVDLGANSQLTNGLGARILTLVLHAPDGSWWQLRGTVAAGESGELERLDSALEVGEACEDLPAFDLGASAELPRGTYAARLETRAFSDDAGLELVEIDGDHTMLGVLPLDVPAPGATR